MIAKLVVDQAEAYTDVEKQEVLTDLAEALEHDFFKAIADPVRQKIVLILLSKGRSSIQDVTRHMTQDRSVVSRHLAQLKQAGLVQQHKHQRLTEYELDGNSIIFKLEKLLNSLRLAAQKCCPSVDEAH